MTRNILYNTAAIAAFLITTASVAFAQLDNRPFSFNSAAGNGVGMSLGGQQAILNDRLFGARPQNLVRDQNGALLEIVKGPGDSAITRIPGTNELLPDYRGRSFTDGNPMMAIGIFNPFFVPTQGYTGACCYTPESDAAINTWTARVVSDGIGMFYNNNSTVDIWTGQVFTLGYYQPKVESP